MLDQATKTKLRDPAYFALHMQAAKAIREAGEFRWYDSNFLRCGPLNRIYGSGLNYPDNRDVFFGSSFFFFLAL